MNYRPIRLSQNKVALIDESDHPMISGYKWSAMFNGHKWYAIRARRAEDGPGPRNIYMHRMILKTARSKYVDHKNGDGLDNRRENLRLATNSQNQANRRVSLGKSRYKGVSWDMSREKWFASITVDQKQTNLGRFDRELDAVDAYDRALRHYFGEFAATNRVLFKELHDRL